MRNLKLFIDPTETALLALYKTAVEKHNDAVLNNPYPNSGFDIYVPAEIYTTKDNTYFIDHKIKATMTESFPHDGFCTERNGIKWKNVPRGFCIYPRSSLSKTPLMLANHVGIIDSGYSGNLIGAFRHIIDDSNPSFIVEKETRLLQICHPGLLPFTVEIVEKPEDLFNGAETTQRGSGGFGSTGK